MKHAFLLAVLALALLLCKTASAIDPDPGEGVPLGIPETTDNAIVGLDNQGQPIQYQHPLGGFYFLRSNNCLPSPPASAPVWTVVWGMLPGNPPTPIGSGSPPGKDPMRGTAQLVRVPSNGVPGEWAKIRGDEPGWVQVRVTQDGAVKDHGWFCFYRIVTLEDQIGNRYGHDARYGGLPGPWFEEEGGSPFQLRTAETAAENLDLFDDRWPSSSIGTSYWAGVDLPQPRTPRRFGESQLLPHPTATWLDSLMAVSRKHEFVRVWVHGPRENKFDIPIYLHITPRITPSGEVHPGGPAAGMPYQIKSHYFKPPDPTEDTNPASGSWEWALNVPTVQAIPNPCEPDGVPPRIHPVEFGEIKDPPNDPDNGMKRKWLLRVPWIAMLDYTTPKVSPQYGDLEVEAQIPNPMNLASVYDPTLDPMEEGSMQFRWGTVLELAKVEVRSRAPSNSGRLKTEWFRRIQYELHSQNAVATPRIATVSLGGLVVHGGEGRTSDLSTLGATLTPIVAPSPIYEDPYLKEVTLNAVSRYIDDSPQADVPNSLWVVAQWPADAREAWFDGTSEKRPDSIGILFRGYAGTVNKEPAVGDFKREPKEPRDRPSSGQVNDWAAESVITRKVPVRFINVLADVNNDGLYDAGDDEDELEEGVTGPGMIINCDPRAGQPDLPVADPNSRKVRLRVSKPAGMEYGDEYEIWLQSPSAIESQLFVWKDAKHEEAIPWDSDKAAFTVPVPVDGANVDVWVSAALGSLPAVTLEFYLRRRYNDGTNGALVWRKEALDEVRLSLVEMGLRVDSNNDGGITSADEVQEDQRPGHFLLRQPITGEVVPPSGLELHRPEEVLTIENAVVTLSKSGGGAVEVKTTSGETILAANQQSAVLPAALLAESGPLLLHVRGVAVGQATLAVSLAPPQQAAIMSDRVELTVVRRELAPTDDVSWHETPDPAIRMYFNGPYYTTDGRRKFQFATEIDAGVVRLTPKFEVASGGTVFWKEEPLSTTQTQAAPLEFSGDLTVPSGGVAVKTAAEPSNYVPIDAGGSMFTARLYLHDSQGNVRRFERVITFKVSPRTVYWFNGLATDEDVGGEHGQSVGTTAALMKARAAALVNFDASKYSFDADSPAELLIFDDTTSRKWTDAWQCATRRGKFHSNDHGITWAVGDTGSFGGIIIGAGDPFNGWNTSVFANVPHPDIEEIMVAKEAPELHMPDMSVELNHCFTANGIQTTNPWAVRIDGSPQEGPAGAPRLIDNMATLVGAGTGSGIVGGYRGMLFIEWLLEDFDYIVASPITAAQADAASIAAKEEVLDADFISDFVSLDGMDPDATRARVEAAARTHLQGQGLTAAQAAGYSIISFPLTVQEAATSERVQVAAQ